MAEYIILESHPNDGRVKIDNSGTIQTLTKHMETGGNNVPLVMKDKTYCLQGNMIGRQDKNGPQGSGINEDIAFTLNATDKHGVVYGIDRAAFNQGKNAQYKPQFNEEQSASLVAKGPNAVGHPSEDNTTYVIRRLTPKECLRLMALPEWWVSDVDGSDTAIYKMCGNGCVVTCLEYIMQNIVNSYKEEGYDLEDDAMQYLHIPGHVEEIERNKEQCA